MPAASPPLTSPPAIAPARLASIDAYRGFVMLLMMAEVLELRKVATALPESWFWKFLAEQQTHVPWAGCTLHDLIQPSFSFLVGVALPFSLASRLAKGQSRWLMFFHAVWRAFLLIALGIFLRSMNKGQTYFTFEDTLSQIGLGYVFLFLLGLVKEPWQWAAFVAIIVGYWLAFVLYPLPDDDFSYAAHGVPADWKYHYEGLAAHWNKNSNLAWAFDTWWLNLFPREKVFEYHPGGYATLSFIPTLGTMILGLIAGNWLRRDWLPKHKLGWLLLAGGILLSAGLIAHEAELCPAVKRIWTPSWTLYSGGWCFLLLAAFYLVIDIPKWTSWSYPLRVIGMNSIAAYVLAHGPDRFVLQSLHIHLGKRVFAALGPAYMPLLEGAAVLLVLWLILWWMERRKIFLKI
jgi:heparan-alpha-glucosaminide N-acetyltransferase